MKKMLKIFAGIFGIILLDQIAKGILLFLITGSAFVFGPAWSVIPVPYLMARVTNFFNIVFTWNPGTAFSLFRAVGDNAPLIMIIATGVIIALLLFYLLRRAKSYEVAPLVLIIGGALGNLVDRIRFGAVIDFLDFHIGGAHWPSFNIADMFITIGVLFYILNWWIARRKCLKNVRG
ncbi:MAG: signal peptidase II [Alphaproteobacteria bacterium]|nr:signal peptidase II [Alphaproteobacteria bacterium]MBR6838399.1 signal peptidase II [Alphaproteobacteria bacterium]